MAETAEVVVSYESFSCRLFRLRALRKHRNMARRIMAKIDDYTLCPEALANVATDLVGKDCRRLRVGDFRVLFRETPTQVLVLDIAPRRGIYD